MASILIRKTWSVDNVLTDPTAIVLSDPTGAYGVKANSDGTIIAATGTAMTKKATGVYEYSKTDVDGATAYTAWVAVTYDGTTDYFEVDVAPVQDTTDTSAMELVDLLILAQKNCAMLLVQITSQPKPSYAVHGHSYSWNEYQEVLSRQIEMLSKLISQVSPYEIISQG